MVFPRVMGEWKRSHPRSPPGPGLPRVAELPDKTAAWTDGHRRFRFREGDLKAWPGATNAEVIVMSRWVESRLPITGIDETERIATFSKLSMWQLDPGDPYYVEGALELIDQPGEWCLVPGGTVYYLPRPGEKADSLDAIAPVLVQTVRFEGKPEAGQFIEGVTLRARIFAHGMVFPPSGKAADGKMEKGGFAQAAIAFRVPCGRRLKLLRVQELHVFSPGELRPGIIAWLQKQRDPAL